MSIFLAKPNVVLKVLKGRIL